MFDAKKLLDQFLGAGAGGAQYDPRGGGQRQGQQPGGGLGDLANQASDFARGNMGGLAGGALAGGLASILLGGGKKSPQLSGSALNLGGLAILGGLAYKAWQNYQEKQQQAAGHTPPPPPPPAAGPVQIAPPPSQTSFAPSGAGEEQQLGSLLLRAMIAAARSDGRIDGGEIAKIREGLKASGAGGDEQTFLLEQLGKPDDLDAIAAEARDPQLASEVWLAARLTIEPDTASEQAFLRTFAQKLRLDEPLVAHLEATAAQAKQSGVAAG